jgi:hypothetical protein
MQSIVSNVMNTYISCGATNIQFLTADFYIIWRMTPKTSQPFPDFSFLSLDLVLKVYTIYISFLKVGWYLSDGKSKDRQMTNNDLQKTKHQVTRSSLKIEGELKCLHTCHKQVTTIECNDASIFEVYLL